MTPWGVEVAVFCLNHRITKKQLAKEAGIPYDTLLQVSKGRRAGHVAQAAVKEVMDRYEAEAKKSRKKGGAAR
jgi:predicted transcriptional regulator